ncbi:hypothetical protein BKA93DRAFT_753060 [Sparassis latifolia]
MCDGMWRGRGLPTSSALHVSGASVISRRNYRPVNCHLDKPAIGLRLKFSDTLAKAETSYLVLKCDSSHNAVEMRMTGSACDGRGVETGQRRRRYLRECARPSRFRAPLHSEVHDAFAFAFAFADFGTEAKVAVFTPSDGTPSWPCSSVRLRSPRVKHEADEDFVSFATHEPTRRCYRPLVSDESVLHCKLLAQRRVGHPKLSHRITLVHELGVQLGELRVVARLRHLLVCDESEGHLALSATFGIPGGSVFLASAKKNVTYSQVDSGWRSYLQKCLKQPWQHTLVDNIFHRHTVFPSIGKILENYLNACGFDKLTSIENYLFTMLTLGIRCTIGSHDETGSKQ